MIKFIVISVLSILVLSCSGNSEKENVQDDSDIGVKNPVETDSLSFKLKQIEGLIESNDKLIQGLKTDSI